MDSMVNVVESLNQYGGIIAVVAALWCLIITWQCYGLSKGLSNVNKKRNRRIEEGSVGEISDSIDNLSNQLERVEVNLGYVIKGLRETDIQVSGCVQRYGLVRFDAFADVGGEQSFALALLDDTGSGIILSNLYGRQDARLYVKHIVKGQADKLLSDEERRAFELATQNDSIN